MYGQGLLNNILRAWLHGFIQPHACLRSHEGLRARVFALMQVLDVQCAMYMLSRYQQLNQLQLLLGQKRKKRPPLELEESIKVLGTIAVPAG